MPAQSRNKFYFFISLLIFISLSCNVLNSTSETTSPSASVPTLKPTQKPIVNLIGRAPTLWMPEPSEFGAFNNLQPKPFSYTNTEFVGNQTDSEKYKMFIQAGRIINYGYEGHAVYCDDQTVLDFSQVSISTTLFKTADGADIEYTYYYNQDKLDTRLQIQTDIGLGDESRLSYGKSESCGISTTFMNVDFRLYNVTGYIFLVTLDNLSQGELQMRALELGKKLEKAIRDELSKNPGSPDSLYANSSSSNKLIWRNPSEWISAPEDFTLFNKSQFIGNFSTNNSSYIENAEDQQSATEYVNNSGRIVSFGYKWRLSACVDAENEMIPSGYLSIASFADKSGAEYSFVSGNTEDLQNSNLVSQENIQLGDQAILSIFNVDSCNTVARIYKLRVQHYNVSGYIQFHTLFPDSAVSDDTLRQYALGLGKQLDELIINEANIHPGSLTALALVRDYAETVSLPTNSTTSTFDNGSSSSSRNDGLCVNLSTDPTGVGDCYYNAPPPVP